MKIIALFLIICLIPLSYGCPDKKDNNGHTNSSSYDGDTFDTLLRAAENTDRPNYNISFLLLIILLGGYR